MVLKTSWNAPMIAEVSSSSSKPPLALLMPHNGIGVCHARNHEIAGTNQKHSPPFPLSPRYSANPSAEVPAGGRLGRIKIEAHDLRLIDCLVDREPHASR